MSFNARRSAVALTLAAWGCQSASNPPGSVGSTHPGEDAGTANGNRGGSAGSSGAAAGTSGEGGSGVGGTSGTSGVGGSGGQPASELPPWLEGVDSFDLGIVRTIPLTGTDTITDYQDGEVFRPEGLDITSTSLLVGTVRGVFMFDLNGALESRLSNQPALGVIAEADRGHTQVFGSILLWTSSMGSTPAPLDGVSMASGLASDPSGTPYFVTDAASRTLHRFRGANTGDGSLALPGADLQGVALPEAGPLAVLDVAGPRVLQVARDLSRVEAYAPLPIGLPGVAPSGIGFTAEGQLGVCFRDAQSVALLAFRDTL